jgi:hypothetical protein
MSGAARTWMQSFTRRPFDSFGLVAVVTIVAIVVPACVALFLAAPILTSDEAKYLAVGRSLLSGTGPVTDLGQRFIVHPPLYAIILAAPGRMGLDPVVWGHLLNAVALAILLSAAWLLARPSGRLQAALVVVVLAAWTYQLDLARTVRLDVPQAALILSYVLATGRACRTGMLRHALLGSALFAWAFLVKESSLIFLVAPFLGALATRAPLRSTLRAAGLTVLSFVVLAGWWFAWYAQQTGTVFAFGLPGWTLPVLAIVVTAVGSGCLLMGILPAEGAIGRAVTRLEHVVESPERRLGLAVALAGMWAALFLLAFARSPLLAGARFLDVRFVAKYALTWRTALALPAAISLGIVPAIVALRREDRLAPPLLALLVGLPWALFAADLGEPPRNDLALAVFAVVGGVAGWSALVAARGRGRAAPLVRAVVAAVVAIVVIDFLAGTGFAPPPLRRTTITLIVVAAVGIAAAIVPMAIDRLRPSARAMGSPDRGRRTAAMLLLVACGVVVVAQAAHASTSNTTTAESANSRVLLAVSGWLRSNAPDGSRVALGSALQQQIAAGLAGRYQLCSMQPMIAEASAASPLGLVLVSNGRQVADPVAIDPHPRRSAFFVFSAAQVSRVLAACRPQYLVYVTGIGSAAPTMVDWLESSASMRLVDKQLIADPGSRGSTFTVRIYAVTTGTPEIPDGRTFVSPAALNALLDGLGAVPSTESIARMLLVRVEVTGDGAEAAAALARLRRAAAPGP